MNNNNNNNSNSNNNNNNNSKDIKKRRMSMIVMLLKLLDKILLLFIKSEKKSTGDANSAEDFNINIQMTDPYRILNIQRPIKKFLNKEELDVIRTQVKKAHRKLARIYHPDKNSRTDATAIMIKVNEARDQIMKDIDEGFLNSAKVREPVERNEPNEQNEEKKMPHGYYSQKQSNKNKGREFHQQWQAFENEIYCDSNRCRNQNQRPEKDDTEKMRSKKVEEKYEELLKEQGLSELSRRQSKKLSKSEKSLRHAIREKAEKAVPHDKSTESSREPIFKTCSHQIAVAIRIFDSKKEIHRQYLFIMLAESFSAMGNQFCAIDEEGNTALHYALFFKKNEVLTLIIQISNENYSEVVLKKNSRGEKPIDLAEPNSFSYNRLSELGKHAEQSSWDSIKWKLGSWDFYFLENAVQLHIQYAPIVSIISCSLLWAMGFENFSFYDIYWKFCGLPNLFISSVDYFLKTIFEIYKKIFLYYRGNLNKAILALMIFLGIVVALLIACFLLILYIGNFSMYTLSSNGFYLALSIFPISICFSKIISFFATERLRLLGNLILFSLFCVGLLLIFSQIDSFMLILTELEDNGVVYIDYAFVSLWSKLIRPADCYCKHNDGFFFAIVINIQTYC